MIERYQFICCSLMTHEIKKYLLHRSGARSQCVSVCVCLEHGYHDNKQSILVTNCGGGWLEGVYAGVFICMPLPVSMCEIRVWYFYLFVWQQDVQTDIQHGWSDLSSHSFDSSEGKNYSGRPTSSILNLHLIGSLKKKKSKKKRKENFSVTNK